MLNMAEGVARLGALAESPIVATLAAAFAAAGHELSIVGGPVRDALLDRSTNDLDFTTDARADEILRIVKPISTAHWDVGREFGTIGARVRDLRSGDVEQVEITTYRADSYDGLTRKPTVEFGDTLEGDLARRDFTVNAMALRVPARTLVDPTGGVEDLVARRLRTPADPRVSFGDDPLRMLRAARFSAQLGFDVDPRTVEAMAELRETLSIVSPERIQGELVRLLQTDDPVRGIRLLVETGLMEQFLPEVPALRLEVDEHHHHKDVYEHSLTVLRQAIELEKARSPASPPDVPLRLAALLHDIGKPATRRLEPGGGVTFHHHDIKGARLARKRLQALRFDSDTIATVSQLIELHLRFFGYAEGAWTDSAVRRYVRDAGPELGRLHILTRADVTTRNKRKAARLAGAYDDIERRIDELAAAEELGAMRPALDGNRIQEVLGIRPGPEVGKAYRYLLEVRLDEGVLDEAEAETRLRAWWAEQG
jgi:poly(A) polymerase